MGHTEHVLFGHVEARDAEGRIGFVIVALNGDLPVMDARAETARAERHTLL